MKNFDVVIIGAGIIGTTIAWHLCRNNLKIGLLEKSSDVANGATRANSGILHSGIHEEQNSEMFSMCRYGLKWYKNWANKLDFPFAEKSTVVLANNSDSLAKLRQMADGHRTTLAPTNHSGPTIRNRWPFLTQKIVGALETKMSAQILPYETCRALLENSIDNGLAFHPNCEVSSATLNGETWRIETNNIEIRAKYVILAAGHGNNQVSAYFDLPSLAQKRISGAYFMLGKTAQPQIEEFIFSPPTAHSKGIVLQKTIHGNLMIGPDSIPVEELEDEQKNWERLCLLWNSCAEMIPTFDRKDIIRTFTGERINVQNEFQLENLLVDKSLIRIDGIKSPGLTVAPAIATKVEKMLSEIIPLVKKIATIDSRKSLEKAVKGKKPGEILCRCEKVFYHQISEAIARGANNIESLRWQTRAGMGGCQGSFCRPQLIATLKNELKLRTNEICLKNKGSEMFLGDLK